MGEYNKIIFKLEEYYNNDGVKEVVPSIGVNGKVIVSAINLLNKDNFEQIETKDRINEIGRPIFIINDTTENLIGINFITDENGYGEVDLSKMLTNTSFIKFYQKYKGQVTLNITIEIPKTDKYNSFVENAKITPNWDKDDTGIIFQNYDYNQNDMSIILELIEDKVTNFATLRQKYKTIEDSYLLIKKQYEKQVVGEVDLEIDTVEPYEPKTFKQVITRLLELQIGTLQPAINYTKTAKLTKENERLITMDRLVTILTNMYPKITIEEGEGIPYNNEKGLNNE